MLQLGIRGVFTNFDILEKYIGLVPIQSATTVEDILKTLWQYTTSMGVVLKKIVSVTNDGAIIDNNL